MEPSTSTKLQPPGAPLSASDKEAVLKLQSFVRGALCRARVSLMVDKLIADLLARKEAKAARKAATVATRDDDEDSLGFATAKYNRASAISTQSVSEILSILEAHERSQPLPPPPPASPTKSPTKPSLSKLPSPAASPRKAAVLPVLQNNATRHVPSSQEVLNQHEERMDAEMQQLLKDIRRIGEQGKPQVTFGELFDDDQVANFYEALVGILKAAKKKGIIHYEGQVLLKGMSDQVVISIVK